MNFQITNKLLNKERFFSEGLILAIVLSLWILIGLLSNLSDGEFQLSTIIIVLSCIILVPLYHSSRNAQNKKLFMKLFFLGVVGWFSAFLLRLIPLNLIQTISMVLLGADPSSLESLMTFSTHPLVMMWGAIFAGLFEEIIRYIILKRRNHEDYFNPFIVGFGWAVGELLFIIPVGLFPFIGQSLGWFNVFILLIERVTTLGFHIALAILIYQSLNRSGLILAIILHIIYDSVGIVWSTLLSNLLANNFIIYYISMQLVLALLLIVTIILIKRRIFSNTGLKDTQSVIKGVNTQF
ncbi:MAG: YhfC family intramembrane metalloprotease [Asgard group archaeon]|nr:YhfC family intramembrane metalloprotease [Asgard group archaeon]